MDFKKKYHAEQLSDWHYSQIVILLTFLTKSALTHLVSCVTMFTESCVLFHFLLNTPDILRIFKKN